jgi:hypothetical protein
MEFADARLHFHIERRAGLDDQQVLAIVRDAVAPSINRSHRPDDIDARGQPFTYQGARNRYRLILAAGGHENHLILWGVRAGISASCLARESFAQFARRASVFESLAIVHEQDRHFLSEARFEFGVAIDFNSPNVRVEIRKFRCDYFFHFAA